MKQLFLGFSLFCAVVANAQDISSFAGCGTMCTAIGDGGPATAANILDPIGGVFDKRGNYYFVQGTGQRVRKVDSAGIIHTIAGTGLSGYTGDGFQASSAKVTTPSAVVLDTNGNIYIADAGNSRIRKITIATGIISTIAGSGTGGYGGDGLPATSSSVMIWDPQDLCFDKFGNLYIADAFNYRIRKVSPTGIITTYAGTGTPGTGGDNGPATNAQFELPSGLAVDDTGNLYIADISNAANNVRKINTVGIITTIAGNGIATYAGDGIPATNAQINPIKVAIDTGGNLIIADEFNDRIFKVDHSGIIHLIAGNGMATYGGDGGPATVASFHYPSGVSFDQCGNLYIPDVNSKRIRKIAFNPSCTIENIALNTGSTKMNIASNSIYPNPATNEITIAFSSTIVSISIANILGQMVLYKKCDKEQEEINIASLPQGVYAIKIVCSDGNTTVSKIVKQ